MDIGLDWRAIKLFLAGWGIGAFFWIPLSILLMRVMAQMGVAQTSKAFRKPTRISKISTWLRQFIYGA